MEKKLKADSASWIDPDDDDLIWTEEMFKRAEYRIGDKVIRPATGTVTKAGRPRSANPKKQVTLRLDDLVIEGFRAKGKGWQSEINAALRKALGL